MMGPEAVVNVHPLLGESPVWDEASGLLYFVDILGQRIFRLSPGRGAVESVVTGEDTGFCVLTGKGRLLAGLESGVFFVDFESGQKDFIAAPPGCGAGFRLNDGKCDAMGRLWAGTVASAWTQGRGDPSMIANLFCLDGSLGLTVKAQGFVIPNGIGFSPDWKCLYFTDTYARTVFAYDFDLDTAAISCPRPAVTLPQGAGMPDGLAVDAEGMLWVCHYGGSMVGRYDPASGSLLKRVELPCRYVTSCAFGGRSLDELYITTARDGAYGPDAGPLAGALFCVRPGVSGARAHKFKD